MPNNSKIQSSNTVEEITSCSRPMFHLKKGGMVGKEYKSLYFRVNNIEITSRVK